MLFICMVSFTAFATTSELEQKKETHSIISDFQDVNVAVVNVESNVSVFFNLEQLKNGYVEPVYIRYIYIENTTKKAQNPFVYKFKYGIRNDC